MSRNQEQKDNTSFKDKCRLRQSALRELGATVPVVLETHGGKGLIYAMCYVGIVDGIVFEKNPAKTEILAEQRETWAVYEGDCATCLGDGVGAHLEVNLLDVDPFGDPWPAIDAFLTSDRPRAPKLVIVVNDGLRKGIRYGTAWQFESVKAMVSKYGNDGMFEAYPRIVREMLAEKAGKVGYQLKRWKCYETGHQRGLVHYCGVFEL